MKITRNTTDWPDSFLRKMVSWCAKQVEVPFSEIRDIEFGKSSNCAFRGRYWIESRRIRVVVGPESQFPCGGTLYPGRVQEAFRSPIMADQLDALVAVVSHELTHLRDRNTRRADSERYTRKEERAAVAAFNKDREALIAEWSKSQKLTPAKKTRAEMNGERARKNLANWEKRLKAAQNKVKKYRKQVKYYDKKQAASR